MQVNLLLSHLFEFHQIVYFKKLISFGNSLPGLGSSLPNMYGKHESTINWKMEKDIVLWWGTNNFRECPIKNIPT